MQQSTIDNVHLEQQVLAGSEVVGLPHPCVERDELFIVHRAQESLQKRLGNEPPRRTRDTVVREVGWDMGLALQFGLERRNHIDARGKTRCDAVDESVRRRAPQLGSQHS